MNCCITEFSIILNVPIPDKNTIEKYWTKWFRMTQCCMDTSELIIRFSNLCHSVCQSLNVMHPSLRHSTVPQGRRAITLDYMSQSTGDWYIPPKYWERLSSHAIWRDFVLWLCKLKRVFHVSCFVRYCMMRGKKRKQERDTKSGSCTLPNTIENACKTGLNSELK